MPQPKPLRDATDEAAKGMLGSLDEPLRTKCRFAYLQARIEAMQKRGASPDQSLLEKHGELEGRLREMDIDPSTVTRRSKHRARR